MRPSNSKINNNEEDYFSYLANRSTLAWFYRKYWLYPKVCRYLSGRVLDVGCGIGDLLAFRRNTIGTDINLRAVEWCRARGYAVEPMRMDTLSFESQFFDGVVMDNVIEHISAPKPLLQEVYRVLRPQGTVLIGVPGEKGYASDSDHKVFYDKQLLVATMKSSNFKLKKIFSMPFRSSSLDKRMRQYCVYGVFVRD
jgi:SAM-dependent methyltransferase